MLITIQCIIDLGNFIIETNGWEIPSTYSEIFRILSNHNWLKREEGTELEKLAKFRNVLVHLYWKIDWKRVYKVLRKSDRIIERFLKKVKM